MALADINYDNSFEGSRVLVTGGAGFIGSHLARRLFALGAEVIVIDDLSGGVNHTPDGAMFVHASILDEGELHTAITGCRFVFHEAAMVSVPMSVEQPQRCFEVNTRGTHRVLLAAADAGVERIVLASSSAVYGGKPSLPSHETDRIDCWSPYAASKAANETMAQACARCTKLAAISLRYFNIFGPGQNANSAYAAVISAFAQALSEQRSPTIFGDGRQTRDFCHIDNVVHANLLAASGDADLNGRTFNIGAGQQTSLLELLTMMNEVAGTRIEPIFDAPRVGDVRDSCADITAARQALGYEPLVDLRAGLTDLMPSV